MQNTDNQTDLFKNNLINNLSVNIFYTNNWLLDKYKEILIKYNLKYNQYYILKILKKTYPNQIPMYLINYSIIDRNINLSRLIDALYNVGLVNRVQSMDDRRVVEVVLTQKGINLLNEIENALEKFENFQNEIEQNQAQTLNELLNSFRESKEINYNFK